MLEVKQVIKPDIRSMPALAGVGVQASHVGCLRFGSWGSGPLYQPTQRHTNNIVL